MISSVNESENQLISLVVPVYNVEEYLSQCVESLLNQTYKHIEIILVDDGSTDNSSKICKDYEKRSNIKVIRQENKGLSGARNTGIEYASGEYIGFVDSDDFVDPDMFKVLYESMKKNNADIACCGRYIFSGEITGKRYEAQTARIFEKEEAMKELLVSGCIDVAAWDKLYKRDLFHDIKFPEREVNEDTAIIYKLITNSKRIVHCGHTLYYYRQRKGSITNKGFSLPKSQLVEKHLKDMEAFIATYYNGFEKLFKTFYVDCNFPLLLAGLKSKKLSDQEEMEVKRRLKIQKELNGFFLRNKNNTRKNKIIAIMIRLSIYQLYLKFKIALAKG